MVELRGGPGDGSRIEFPDAPVLGMYESRYTCSNPDHVEVRIHIYLPDGVYQGCGSWLPRDRASLRGKVESDD